MSMPETVAIFCRSRKQFIASQRYQDPRMATKYRENLARQVKERIKARGWLPKDLATHSGVSYRTVNNVLNPNRPRAPSPTLSTLEAIAKALRCTVVDLIAPQSSAEVVIIENYRRAEEWRQQAVKALVVDSNPKQLALPPPPSDSTPRRRSTD